MGFHSRQWSCFSPKIYYHFIMPEKRSCLKLTLHVLGWRIRKCRKDMKTKYSHACISNSMTCMILCIFVYITLAQMYSLFFYNLVRGLIVWEVFWICIMFYNKVCWFFEEKKRYYWTAFLKIDLNNHYWWDNLNKYWKTWSHSFAHSQLTAVNTGWGPLVWGVVHFWNALDFSHVSIW